MNGPLGSALRGPVCPVEAPCGLPGLVRAQAERTPDAVACRDASVRLRYAALDARSDALAARIESGLGSQRGAVVLYLPRGVDLMVALLGVLKAGCWYLPVALDEPEPRVAAMVATAGPVAVIAAGPLPAPLHDLPLIAVPTAAALQRRPLRMVRPDDPAYVLFTSGSSGRPKGVLVGSDALVNRILWMAREYRFGPDDVVLQKTPYTFDVSGWEFYVPVISGGCCAFAPEGAHRDPVAVAGLIDRYGVTACHFVPSMLTQFLDTAEPAARRLRLIACSGEALPAPLAARTRARFPALLHNLYGPTEAAIDVTAWPVPAGLRPDDTVLIGAPIDNTELYVLDPDGGPVPDGEAGELWIGGIPVALGYLDEPELTARAFPVIDGARYYRTGDLVQRVGDQLRYLGRLDDQVKVRGVRIELGEVEQALLAHPAVRQAVAAPVADDTGAVELGAALVPADPADPPPIPELRAFLRTRLPGGYVPAELHWVTCIPVSRTGKADRRAARELLAAARVTRRPQTEGGDVLAGIWGQMLPGATDADRFLDLGGHSLMAAQLRAMVRAALDQDLPLEVLLGRNACLAEARASLTPIAHPPVQVAGEPPRTVLPLTADQRGVWLTCRLFPECAVYNVVGAVRLRGQLDLAAVRCAIARTARRHDALRMRLVEQAPAEPGLMTDAVPPPEVAVTSVAGPLDDAAIARFCAEVAGQPITLNRAALWRVAVLAGADDACMVVALSHLIADQRALDLVLADLAASYGGTGQDRPGPRFAGHMRQRQAAADGQSWRSHLAYWHEILDGAPAELGLPFRSTSRARSLRGASHRLDVGPERSARLEVLRRRYGVTPAMLFLGVTGLVLSAWSGRGSVVIGVPASRRETAADWDTVGFFTATLPLRLDVHWHSDAQNYFAHVRDRHATALARAEPAFAAIVDACGRAGRPDGDALFQAWFNDLTGAASVPSWAGLDCAPVEVPSSGAIVDVNLYLRHDPATGYRLELARAADRVPAEVGAELLDQCGLVLDQLLTGPDMPFGRLDLRTGRWRRYASAELCEPAGDGLALAAPPSARVAVRSGTTTLTYHELHAAADALASRLTAAGIAPADLVEVRARRCTALPVALLGVWRAGGVAALVDTGWPPARLNACAATLAAQWRVDCEDGALLRISGTGRGPRKLPGTSHALFTTGTTGEPAVALIPHGALERAFAWYGQAFTPTPADRYALLGGLGHDPVLRDLLVPLRTGGTLVIPDQQVFARPDRLLELLADERVTVLHATPALLELLLAMAEPGARLPALRLVISGGALLPADLVRRLRRYTDAVVVNGYGTTEVPQLAAAYRVCDTDGLGDDMPLPVGTAASGHQPVVLTAAGVAAGIGQLGEVVIRGRYLATGYLAGGAAERFRPDPLGESGVRAFGTGDLGRIDPWGRLHIDGRRDRQVSVNGFRVALAEVEAAALRHPGIRQCVAGIVDTPAGPILAIETVPALDASLTEAAVRGHLREMLPRHAVPTTVRVVARLATDQNHKAVLHPDPAAWALTSPAAAPAGASEAPGWLAGLLRDLVGRQVAPGENFFDAGLTSIGLLRLHAVLADRLDDPPSPIELFAHPSLDALARRLEVRADEAMHATLARRPQRRGTADLTRVNEATARRRAARRGNGRR